MKIQNYQIICFYSIKCKAFTSKSNQTKYTLQKYLNTMNLTWKFLSKTIFINICLGPVADLVKWTLSGNFNR